MQESQLLQVFDSSPLESAGIIRFLTFQESLLAVTSSLRFPQTRFVIALKSLGFADEDYVAEPGDRPANS